MNAPLTLTLVPRDGDEPDVALVEASGSIGQESVPALEEAFARLVDQGKRRIVLDLSGIRYVASSGFGALVKQAEALEALGGGIALLGVPPKVNVVIEMLGLETMFSVVCKQRPGAFAVAS